MLPWLTVNGNSLLVCTVKLLVIVSVISSAQDEVPGLRFQMIAYDFHLISISSSTEQSHAVRNPRNLIGHGDAK